MHYIFTILLTLLTVPTLAAENHVHITKDSDYRYIKSNGIPDHAPGTFPNKGNPNSISAQSYRFRIPLKLAYKGVPTPLEHMLFGVALNGVPLDPGTAEYWNNDRSSGWRFEALSGHLDLGLDRHNAHVQPTGAYHYHGMPHEREGLVGYAADGFPIYIDKKMRSSYQLKSGFRNSGPGAKYDGRFVQDYTYIEGTGNLDECNGKEVRTGEYPQGVYAYFLTDTFPFIPRCFKGDPDESFRHGPPDGMRGGPQHGRRPPPHHHHGHRPPHR